MGDRKNSRLAIVFVYRGSSIVEPRRIRGSFARNDGTMSGDQRVDFAAQQQRFSGFVHNRDVTPTGG